MPGEASGTVEGVSNAIVGSKLLTDNDVEFDVPPPGVGFDTVIVWFPARVALAAGSTALSWIVETKLMDKLFPSKLTFDALLNPEPASVTAVSADPTETPFGVILLIEGGAYERETWAELLFVESTWLVAVIVMVLPLDGIGSGAV